MCATPLVLLATLRSRCSILYMTVQSSVITDLPTNDGYLSLSVSEVVDEAPDVRSFVLDVPPHQVAGFGYLAGQYVTLRVRIDGLDHLRCYSLSSTPGVDSDLRITVKRTADGLVSNWLHDVAVGDTLEVRPPAGRFTIRDRDSDVVLLASGSGITPVYSILKSLLHTTDRNIGLLYGNRTRQTTIFAGELDELASTLDGRLSVTHHIYEEDGYLRPDDVMDFIAHYDDPDIYLCGSKSFAETVLDSVALCEVPSDRLFTESYTPQDVGHTEIVVHASEASSSAEPGGPPAEVVITLDGRRRTLPYAAGDSLLETARRAGLSPPFSCEAGNCGSCVALLKEGEVAMGANSALMADELAEGWILTCQGVPRTKRVVLEYPG